MTGSRGTGKSHLGVAIVRDMLGYYVCMEDVIYKIESNLITIADPANGLRIMPIKNFLNCFTGKVLIIH